MRQTKEGGPSASMDSRRRVWMICALILFLAFMGGLFVVISSEKQAAASRVNASVGMGDCGAYSLGFACDILGIKTDIVDLREKLAIPVEHSTTFARLKEVAQQLGCRVEAVAATPSSLANMKFPAIAFVDRNHFLTLAGWDLSRSRLLVLDGPSKPQWVKINEFARRWTGELLLLSNDKMIPGLWFGGSTVELGTFSGGGTETVEIGIANPTNQPISVMSIQFSCSCASQGRIDPPVIPPNSAARLIFHLDASAQPLGPFEVKMFVKTDMPARPGNLVTLRGRTAINYAIKPSFFSLGEVVADAPERELLTRVQFSTGSVDEFTPLAIGHGLSLKSSQLVGFSEYELRIGFNATEIPPAPSGVFKTQLILLPTTTSNTTSANTKPSGIPSTQSESAPTILNNAYSQERAFSIDVVGRIVPPIQLLPVSFYGGILRQGQEISGRVQIKCAPEVESVRISHKGQGIRKAELNGEWLNFIVETPANPGLFSSTIELTAGERRTTLPIVVYITK